MKTQINKAWGRWKKISVRAMEFQAKVILSILYFSLLFPLGLWYKYTHDILKQKKSKSMWSNWPHNSPELEINSM